MARLPRYLLPGQPQHLIQRGNNRQAIFFADEDYSFFLECTADAAARYGCQIHAYVLMTNHVHLLLTPEQPGSISKTMQSVGRRYVQYVNYTYSRTGTLWEGRFRATPLDTDGYLLICHRYIELNPVRAGLVSHPRHYRWSSYRSNAEGRPDSLILQHPVYRDLGRSEEARRAAYRALFKAAIGEGTMAEIRESVNKGWALGTERFKAQIEAAGERRARPKPRGGARRSVDGLGETEVDVGQQTLGGV